MPNTEQLYLIKLTKAATGGVLQKNLFSNISKYLQENTCSSLFFIKVQTFRRTTLIKKTPTQVFSCCEIFAKYLFLKNICVRLLLNWLDEVIVWNFVSGQSVSKPTWLSNITKIPVAFKPELLTEFGAYAVFIFNPYTFFWT